MSTGGAVDCDAGTPANGTDGTLDLGAFCEHRFTVELADVVRIDVDRQARHVENEQIERGAALQGETPFEIRMAIEPVEEIEEQGDLSRISTRNPVVVASRFSRSRESLMTAPPTPGP